MSSGTMSHGQSMQLPGPGPWRRAGARGVTAERLAAGRDRRAARKALASVPALRTESPTFCNWLAEPGAKPKAVPRRAKGQTLTTAMEDGITGAGHA